MKIWFTKNNSKQFSIRYERDNGSSTWMKADSFFIRHDLSHYAIEKTLGYKTAFFGMINHGMEPMDFEDNVKRKLIPITSDACYAENMANLFLMEIAQEPLADFNGTLKEAFVPIGATIEAPVLEDVQLTAIRKLLRQLWWEWDLLPVGQSILLTIDC